MKTLIKLVTLFAFVIVIIGFTGKSTAQTSSKVVKKEVYVGSLPSGCKVIIHKKSKFYYHNGFYYRKAKRGYKVVNPPVGFKIKTLPRSVKKIVVSHRAYYKLNNIYYKFDRKNNIYVVVKKP